MSFTLSCSSRKRPHILRAHVLSKTYFLEFSMLVCYSKAWLYKSRDCQTYLTPNLDLDHTNKNVSPKLPKTCFYTPTSDVSWTSRSECGLKNTHFDYFKVCTSEMKGSGLGDDMLKQVLGFKKLGWCSPHLKRIKKSKPTQSIHEPDLDPYKLFDFTSFDPEFLLLSKCHLVFKDWFLTVGRTPLPCQDSCRGW